MIEFHNYLISIIKRELTAWKEKLLPVKVNG